MIPKKQISERYLRSGKKNYEQSIFFPHFFSQNCLLIDQALHFPREARQQHHRPPSSGRHEASPPRRRRSHQNGGTVEADADGHGRGPSIPKRPVVCCLFRVCLGLSWGEIWKRLVSWRFRVISESLETLDETWNGLSQVICSPSPSCDHPHGWVM